MLSQPSSITKCSFIALASLLGLCMACDTGGEIKLTGHNRGHITYDMKVKATVRFLIIGDPNYVTPEYVIDFYGYPYNRIIFKGSLVSRNEIGKLLNSTPIDLVNGSTFDTQVTLGDFVNTYTTTVRTDITLPAGSYILDAPGMVQDIQLAQATYPGAGLSFTTSGLMIQPTLPPSSELAYMVQSQIGTNSVFLSVPPSDMTPWGNLITAPEPPPPGPGDKVPMN